MPRLVTPPSTTSQLLRFYPKTPRCRGKPTGFLSLLAASPRDLNGYVQEGLEAEQADVVGRQRYERGERNGYRSGYKPGKLDSAEGRVSVALPQVRDAQQFFHAKLFELLKGDSQRLESLATEMYARGWSTRDIEAAFTDENGVCLLSRSGVSEVSEALWEEYEAFQQRDLSDLSVLYVFLDGLYEPLRMHGIQREAVLCAWAITTEGDKVLLSLALGNKTTMPGFPSFATWSVAVCPCR